MKLLTTILISILLLSSACSTLLRVQPVEVKGVAMLPALGDGDKIIIDRKFDTLQRGDIVIFLFPQDQTKSYLKRIIGLPHDVVEIREATVLVNGSVLDEPYIDPKFNQRIRSCAPVKLAEDHYYVLGDNRDNSSDSRIWGPLERKFIYGRYVKKYFEAER